MKKKIIIISVILLILIIPMIFLIFNKTFFKKYYKINENTMLNIPNYSIFLSDKDYIANFISFKKTEILRNEINHYVENLISCYDESYFYDEENNISIKSYNIDEGPFYNKYQIEYSLSNLCENEYVLDDDWFEDFKNNAVINEIELYNCSDECSSVATTNNDLNNVLNYIEQENYSRIENDNNINFDSTKDYYINVYYTENSMGYMMHIFSYENNLAIKVIDDNDHPKNAIYQLDNVNINEILKNIFNSY